MTLSELGSVLDPETEVVLDDLSGSNNTLLARNLSHYDGNIVVIRVLSDGSLYVLVDIY